MMYHKMGIRFAHVSVLRLISNLPIEQYQDYSFRFENICVYSLDIVLMGDKSNMADCGIYDLQHLILECGDAELARSISDHLLELDK